MLLSGSGAQGMTTPDYATAVAAVLSDDTWGPTADAMESIAADFPDASPAALPLIQAALDARDDAWRPCFKALLLLQCVAVNAPAAAVAQLRAFAPTLDLIHQEFHCLDDDGGHGEVVRARAQEVGILLKDETVLSERREKAARVRAMRS